MQKPRAEARLRYPQQHEGLHIVTPASEMSATDSVLQQGQLSYRQESTRSGTILVVDDDEKIRSLIRTLLEGSGLVVEEASDATEALQKADMLRESLSVLVTDVVMPGTSGTELAYTLGRKYLRVPVVFMSGYAAGEQLDKLFEQATFLQKPFSRATLVNAVRAGMARCASPNGRNTGLTVQ
jgi:FixJ family two-component response regulator